MELDLAPDRTGLIPPEQVAGYSQIGAFIQSCYGSPIIPSITSTGNSPGVYDLQFDAPALIDRIVLMENQTNGQVIRSYEVYGKLVHQDTSSTSDLPFTLLSNGTSVGHKKIDILETPVAVMEIMVNSTYADTPTWRSVSVYLCDNLPWSQSASSTLKAAEYNSSLGTQNQPTSDVGGGDNVGWISNANWLGYYNVDFGSTSPTHVVARVAAGAGSTITGSVLVNLDTPTTTPVANLSISSTGGWQNWVNVSTSISGVTGYHDVYLTFSSDQSANFVNVNWFTFN